MVSDSENANPSSGGDDDWPGIGKIGRLRWLFDYY